MSSHELPSDAAGEPARDTTLLDDLSGSAASDASRPDASRPDAAQDLDPDQHPGPRATTVLLGLLLLAVSALGLLAPTTDVSVDPVALLVVGLLGGGALLLLAAVLGRRRDR